MHPRTRELLDLLDHHRTALLAAVEQVPHAARDRAPAPGRWSVAQLLEHLYRVERGTATLLAQRIPEARAEGLGPEAETSSVLGALDAAALLDRARARSAPEPVRPKHGLSAEAALAALAESRAALRTAVLAGDGLALGTVTHAHPALGILNLYQWVLFIAYHEGRHVPQVHEIAAQLAAG